MRQLVELHDHLSAFEALDADIIAIAQKETDPAKLARIQALVGDGITIVCDPRGESSALSLFGTFLIDGSGRMRRAIPGVKQARARTDVILSELASMTGRPTPGMAYRDGRVAVEGQPAAFDQGEVLSARWAFSHDAWLPGGTTKLMFLPEIAPGWHVYAPGTELMKPLALSVDVPDGVQLTRTPRFPRPHSERDELLEAELSWYERDVPIEALVFSMDDDFEGDVAEVTLRLSYQACLDDMCLPPDELTWTLSLPVAEPGAKRGQLYYWESW